MRVKVLILWKGNEERKGQETEINIGPVISIMQEVINNMTLEMYTLYCTFLGE